jgi:hypothetical protein
MICKFCGKKISAEKFISPANGGVSCGECTEYCTKKCSLGKSGKVQGWHFEPCKSCEKNPYNKRTTTPTAGQ